MIFLAACTTTSADRRDDQTLTPTPVVDGGEPTSEPTAEPDPTPAPDPTPTAAPPPEPEEIDDVALFPIRDGDVWGYIDDTGAVVIEPQWERAFAFSGDRATVYHDGQWGAIDPDGNAVVELSNMFVAEFSEGYAAIAVDWEFGHHGTIVEGVWGFIDRMGAIVIEPQFERVGSFSEGLASVIVDGQAGFIDHIGEFVIDPSFEQADEFSEGLAMVVVEEQVGFIDHSGELKIEPRYECCDAGPFSEGRAWVRIDGQYGLIDDEGTLIIGPQFETAFQMSEGRAVVIIDGSWGFADRNGALVIEPRFDRAQSFSDGMAAVQFEGEWGYIDHEGEYVIEPQFDRAYSFANGLAVVGVGEQFHLEGGFDHLVRFDGWNYIDTSGDVVWGPAESSGAISDNDLIPYLLDEDVLREYLADVELDIETFTWAAFYPGIPGLVSAVDHSGATEGTAVTRFAGICDAELSPDQPIEVASAYRTSTDRSGFDQMFPPSITQSVTLFEDVASARAAFEWLQDDAFGCEVWSPTNGAFEGLTWEFTAGTLRAPGDRALDIRGRAQMSPGIALAPWDLLIAQQGPAIVMFYFVLIDEADRLDIAQVAVERMAALSNE
jgi:hypothetical protein